MICKECGCWHKDDTECAHSFVWMVCEGCGEKDAVPPDVPMTVVSGGTFCGQCNSEEWRFENPTEDEIKERNSKGGSHGQ
ncbi:hypothetical protein LCGC14_0702360 [marine sediment metagenome]|uniref:Uncharacterized protein n=1 Tax=marine sediment metagenome TaxID=412755 RepID=A0A0F9TQ53_9ZZZZ